VLERKAEAIGGLAVPCDVSDAASIDRALATARAAHGPTRIVVNSAADGSLVPAFLPSGEPSPAEHFLQSLRTNLFGPYYIGQQVVAALMRESALADGARGVIINVSSIAASDGPPGAPAYTAAKGGLNALTLSLAREFSPWGVRVVTLVPGPVDTEMAREQLAPEMRAAMSACVVFPKRVGMPEEFARLAMHVIDNDFINACTIRFDGGMRVPFMAQPPPR
jgi:NAD(P)-dependent dehydrogenase (short-subunit alcohol dehydrogenase family)